MGKDSRSGANDYHEYHERTQREEQYDGNNMGEEKEAGEQPNGALRADVAKGTHGRGNCSSVTPPRPS
jgi:hypothetical protein